MNLDRVKRRFEYGWSQIPRYIFSIFYTRPKLMVDLFLHPAQYVDQTYFPEKQRKGKIRIFTERIWNIIRHSDIDEYYFMYGLDVKREVKNSDYVLYRDFLLRRDYLNLFERHNDSAILRNKLFFEAVARILGIDTPRNIAYSDNGRLTLIKTQSSVKIGWAEFLNILDDAVIYVKPIDGECGSGIRKLEVRSHEIYHREEKLSTDHLQDMFGKGRYIFQEALKQHSEMNRLYPLSVNTIRMITVRNPKTNEIEILPPTLRIGAHGNYVDNFSQGGVIVAMDTESGKLSEWGFYKPLYGFKGTEHPDTKIRFETFEVPYFKEAKEMARYFHSFLNLHSIGWDIAISENGPVFIEGNDNWEVNLPQTFENPFKKEFKRLFY
ncbi:MAG: hypothetical protein K2H60_03530 [Muribaculaceae bacterium]|nr:hypothetical protein [Muribaculaceae bacterium]